MNNIVRMAEEFAEKKHLGQVDRAGVLYIEHPRAVAAMVDGDIEKAVAFLHDTLEDTDTRVDEIRELFGDEIADAVLCLTRRKSESYTEPYMSYIKRVKENELARRVKIADLTHNMDLSRLGAVTDLDVKRVERYKKALRYLE